MNSYIPTKKLNSEEAPAHDWHPADIKAALHKAGWTLSALAAKHGLKSGNTLSKALTVSYPVAETRIADAIGIAAKNIWPSRYYENGTIKPRGFHSIHLKRIKSIVNDELQPENSNESA